MFHVKRWAVSPLLLLQWNRAVNLISARRRALAVGSPHWQFTATRPLDVSPTDRAIDLGSGAGFPGLILALATGVPFDLIEADKRKAAFLLEAARITGAPRPGPCGPHRGGRIPPAPLITARALAPLPKLLPLAAPLLTPGGTCLFLKGANAKAELTHAAAQWHMQVEASPAGPSQTPASFGSADLSRVVQPHANLTATAPGVRSSPSPTRKAASARPQRRSTSRLRLPPTTRRCC